MGITPPFHPGRYQLVDDPEKIKVEKWLDTVPAWELDKAMTDEVLEILQRPKILVERDQYTQLSFDF